MDVEGILLLVKGDVRGGVQALKDVRKEIDETDEKAKKAHGSMAKLGQVLQFGAAVGAGVLTAAVGDGIVAFKDWQTANAGLMQALKDTGQAIPQDKLDALEGSMRNLGHTDTETEQTLRDLVLAGVPATQAMSDMGTVADLAAAKHISMSEAVNAVAMSANGRLSPTLKELGIHLKKGETGAAAFSDIMGQLQPRVGGQAAAQSQTFAGALAKMNAAWDHIAVTVGQKVAPYLQQVAQWITDNMPAIQSFISNAVDLLVSTFSALGDVMSHTLIPVLGFLGDHMTAVKVVTMVLVGAFALIKAAQLMEFLVGLGGSFLATAAEEGVMTAATELFGITAVASALSAAAAFLLPLAPFILIGAAIAALVYLVVTHFTQIKNFVTSVVGTIVNWIKEHLTLLGIIIATVLLGPLGLMVALVVTHLKQIEGFFHDLPGHIADIIRSFAGKIGQIGTDIINWIKNAIVGAAVGVFSWFHDLPGKIGDVIKGFESKISDFGKKIIQWIIDGVKSMGGALGGAVGDMVKGIPGVGAVANFAGGVGSVVGGIGGFIGKHLATGGDAQAGDTALVGEDGPEVVRFGANAHVFPTNTVRSAMAGQNSGGQSAGASGGVVNNIVVNNPAPEPASTSVERNLRHLSFMGRPAA